MTREDIPDSAPTSGCFAAPSGVVALVFTDVQGSTTLWERRPDAMRTALLLHDEVLRAALTETGGYEVKTEGDAFMVSFTSCIAAARWCILVQQRLLNAPWPADILTMEDAREERGLDGQLLWRGFRVRMGLHAGEPESRPDPLTGRMDYFGPMVNRAARVAGAAHGGQLLLSGWSWQLVQAVLARLDVSTVDLGEHRLRGIESSERLVQVLPNALAARQFPAPRTVETRKTNLVPAATPYIGRTTEIRTLIDDFQSGARCITLIGPGGMGKTRLASRVATLVLDEYSRQGNGGVWFADLTEARTLEGVCLEVGRVLGVPLVTGQTAEDSVTVLSAAIAVRGPILLVLDNLEQVVIAARPALARWLQGAPNARFLLTSREHLGVAGERLHELRPLSLAGEGQRTSDAVDLFVERVRAVRPNYTLSDVDRPAVEGIVLVLEGIPLAIELAAARMRMFQPVQLLDRLRRNFDVLGSAPRGLGDKQGTLRSAIEWSWELLEPAEKRGLSDCSVFRGGFTLEAAEAVMAVPTAFDLVAALRDRSLIRTYDGIDETGEMRFGLYETIRQFAGEDLETGDRGPHVRRLHALHYVGQCRQLLDDPETARRNPRLWMRLAPEIDNLQAALHHLVAEGDSVSASNAVVVAMGLNAVLAQRGPVGLLIEHLDAAIAAGSDNKAMMARARAARGKARRKRGEHQRCAEEFEAAMELARDVGDRALQARIQCELGVQRMVECRKTESQTHFESALATALEIDDVAAEASISHHIAWLSKESGDLGQADVWARRALARACQAGDVAAESGATSILASIAFEQGRTQEAVLMVRRAIALADVCGHTLSSAIMKSYLGSYQEALGHVADARESYLRAAGALRAVGDVRMLAIMPALLGGLEAQTGDLADAEQHFDEAQAVAHQFDLRFTAVCVDLRRGHLDLAQARLATAAGDHERASALRALAVARIDRAVAPMPVAGQSQGTGASAASQSDDVRLDILLLRRDLALTAPAL